MGLTNFVFNCVNARNNNQKIYKTNEFYFLQNTDNKWYQIIPRLAMDLTSNALKVSFDIIKGFADENNHFQVEHISKKSKKMYKYGQNF